MLNFVGLVSERDEFIEFLSDPLQHEEILVLLMLVSGFNRKGGNLNQTTQGVVPEVVRLEHHHKFVNHVCVDDVVERDPAEKGVESLKTCPDEGRFGLMCILEDEFAEFEDGGEILVHLCFEIFDL